MNKDDAELGTIRLNRTNTIGKKKTDNEAEKPRLVRKLKSVSFDLFDDTYQKNVGRIEIKFDEEYKRFLGLNTTYSLEQVIMGQLVKDSNFRIYGDSVEYLLYEEEVKDE
jgi:hypothetical protein